MNNAYFKIPTPKNEPVLSYAPKSKEREALKKEIALLKSQQTDVPMIINGKEVVSKFKLPIHPPHEIKHTLGFYNKGDKTHVNQAIEAALNAKKDWENLSFEQRAAIFLRAADLLAGPYRARMNAATMLGQSKNVYQSEIDAVCELCDFLRFNAYFASQIYAQQPENQPNTWNRLDYRPLEGFVFALTPFNFTSIAGNLCAAPALMGNTIVWKVADTQVYSAKVIMDIYKEAGLPDGVINLIFVDGPVAGDIIFKHREFAGLHFTGSTKVFQNLWQTIGENIEKYKSYPRVVGETGGKDFVVAHKSANPKEVAVGLLRGAFEYQGQKCSAASRAYISKSIWEDVKKHLIKDLSTVKMGTVEDFSNFVNAVIDEKSYNKITGYIAQAKKDAECEIIAGGNYDKNEGYFISPTVILTKDPNYVTMREELFGPVLTVYVFEDAQFEETLKIVDNTSPYALTGAIFAKDRYVLDVVSETLKHAAGNFYINDKPTGAVVGQQPFGGARASGTNDKAGSILNLYRWVSPRTIKENFLTPTSYEYPFMEKE
ncbi:MAG: L-glutamate gamma-semialdehyde dehydrogenase [Saprospiraceae bacterium]|nr:L-glutamate gamma-semialdehyde dehydrogenase [Saprospiraceae bacterium]